MSYNLKHRLFSGLMAGMMCCTMVPTAFAAEDAAATPTPEVTEDAAQEEATPQEPLPAEETIATPETAAGGAQFSFTIGANDLDGFDHMNPELFALGYAESEQPYGAPVPLLVQVNDPTEGSTLTVTLAGDASFTDPDGEDDNGTEYARTFEDGEQAAAWLLYVQADSDFIATATYTNGETSQTKTATVTMKDVPTPMALARSSEDQYHITGVTKVDGEWLITLDGEYHTYCLDQGLDGQPTGSVYWTYYGTTDLLSNALAAGCSSKVEIQRWIWAHRGEASDSGPDYVYAASAAGWQNIVTTLPPRTPVPTPTPTTPGQTTPPTTPPTYDAEWEIDITESATASFSVSMTVNVDKYANVTLEKLTDAEITVSADPAGGGLDGGDWGIDPASQIIKTVNGDGSVTFTYHGSVSKSASRSDSGSVDGMSSQEDADSAAESERAEAESNLRAEASADAQNQANAAANAAAQIARQFLLSETGVPYGFDPTADSNQSQTVQPNGSVTATIANQPWRAFVKWEKLDAITGGRLTEDTEFEFYEWSVAAGDYQISTNYRVVRLADGTYTVRVTNPDYVNWEEGSVYFTQANIGKFKIVEKTSAYGYTQATQNGSTPWTVEFAIDCQDKVVEYLGENADRNKPWGNKVIIRKTDSETGNAIAADASFSLYEWNAARSMYEISPNYAIVRDADGSYTVQCLQNWPLAEYGSLYFEDTLCDTREDTASHDGTAGAHHIYYTDYDMSSYPNARAYTNDGQFLVVEHQAPNGYYGDWTDITTPGNASSDLGKRAYYLRLTGDGSTITLGNADYNADIATANNGGVLVETADGVVSALIYPAAIAADRTYQTDDTGIAANENTYTMTANTDTLQNDRVLGSLLLTKVDLDAMRYLAAGSNGETTLEGAVYDLYAAEDIHHPDGVSGVVDYSKITYANGSPIWHTTVLTNGAWQSDYLPILAKDHLVASAAIENGQLAFANLYLGRYYLVERATGLVLPLDSSGQYYLSGQYPELDKRLNRTGSFAPLATDGSGAYTDYVYRNQYSAVAEGRALDGSKTYDGYYLSYATGYLCDEINHYQLLRYGGENQHIIRAEEQSQDEVLKSGFSLQKLVSTTGQPSPALKLGGAGFTIYRISDLSKAAAFAKNPDGSYDIQSILDAYRKDSYDQNTKKYDFTAEGQAVATMYEGSTATVNAYNATLTAAGDNANGSGNGWVPTSNANEYRLSEIFTNEEGVLRVQGLPYAQYLVVETTVPKDVFQADPFIVKVDAGTPQSAFTVPMGSVTTASNSYLTYNILDEELEGYLQVIKIDAETGKAVALADTAFQIYAIHDGKETLVEMTDPRSGNAWAKTSVFYTDETGYMKTPEKLPLGTYRIVEVEGPYGFYNDTQYNVVFELTSERVYQVSGNSTDDMDDYVITESYVNHETLGQITIRKVGNVLVGYEDGQFVYEQDNLANATYEIRAHGDIATADNQGTLWYADGDLVATVTTGAAGHVDEVTFAPNRTPATYEFLKVTHDGTKGEVTITLPLGSYDIAEVQAPYGFIHTDETYTVTLGWDNQYNDVVLAKTIVDHTQDDDEVYSYNIVNVKDATDSEKEEQVMVFENARVLPVVEEGKVGVGAYKLDRDSAGYSDDAPYRDGVKTNTALLNGGSNRAQIPADAKPVAGAVYELYTTDDIYSLTGELLANADTLLATATTDETGLAYFEVDVPIRGENYGTDHTLDWTTNSGRYYIREVAVPEGYLIEQSVIPVEFTYENQFVAWQVVDCLHSDKQTTVEISKTAFAAADPEAAFALPGATLTVTDWEGNVVDTWETTDTAHVIRGLHLNHDFAGNNDLGKVYTLTETRPADGYTTARSIPFKLAQAKDAEGRYTQEIEVWVLEETASAEYQAGSIVSPIAFSDDTVDTSFATILKNAWSVLWETVFGSEENDDGVVIANWLCTNGTLVVTFTEDATEPAIAKCLRESDFADLTFDTVYLENGSVPGFFADKQVAEKPADTDIIYTNQWVLADAQTIAMRDAPTVFRISKVDITTHAEVEGATLKVIDKDGNAVDEWLSGKTPHYIEGKLVVGETYTLVETLAPTAQGYVPANAISFTVEDDGKVQHVFMQDDYTKLTISKTDITTGAEIHGAELEIRNAAGEVIAQWVTDGQPHYIERIPVGIYMLVETQAPTEQGYVKAEAITFEVGPTGDIQKVEMKDDYTKVEISKTDMTDGHELTGAHLKITDSSGSLVAEWTTDGQPHRIDRLQPGSYTLTETAAPDGYQLAESVNFTVAETGEIQKVSMKDAPNRALILSKQDAATRQLLPGARMTVRNSSGETLAAWTTGEGNFAMWVFDEATANRDPRKNILTLSTDSKEFVYTLTEEAAPFGYTIAEPIAFKVMELDGTLTLFTLQNGGWQKADVNVLIMLDEGIPNAPETKPFPQTGN